MVHLYGNFSTVFITRMNALIIFFIVFSLSSLYGESSKPLSISDLQKLKSDSIPQETIVTIAKKNGISFSLSSDNVIELAELGFSKSFVKQLDGIKPPDGRKQLSISSPLSGDEVGSQAPVSGNVGNIPKGKHLWVCVRRELLPEVKQGKWWPQQGQIDPEPNGTWAVGVSFGGPQDIGFHFQIIAVLVDDKTNQDFETYISHGVATNDYRPVKLPSGFVCDTIIVKKIR